MFSYQVVSDSLQPHELQRARLPCPSTCSGVCPRSCPLHPGCHPTISPLSPSSPSSPCLTLNPHLYHLHHSTMSQRGEDFPGEGQILWGYGGLSSPREPRLGVCGCQGRMGEETGERWEGLRMPGLDAGSRLERPAQGSQHSPDHTVISPPSSLVT